MQHLSGRPVAGHGALPPVRPDVKPR